MDPDKDSSNRHAGKKVLCIEDEHFISELYTRALTRGGYDVTVIADGQEGLEAARSDQYDIILLDLMVPTITGVEILRRLRGATEEHHAIKAKIIVTTNLEQREDVRADIEKQADGYIVKAEITPHELVALLDRLA